MAQLTVLVHGIRTHGGWQGVLESLIRESDPGHQVVRYQYGPSDVVRFFLPFFRRRAIRALQEFFRDLRHERGPDSPINIVCHSFGTVLVAEALRRLPAAERPRVRLLITAGSVLRSDFNWGAMVRERSMGMVVNDCGLRDLWPGVATVLLPGLGGAGRVGFHGTLGLANRFFPDTGHGGFFREERMRARWLPLLASDEALRAVQCDELADGWLAAYQSFSEIVKVSAYVFVPVLVVGWAQMESLVQKRQAQAERRNRIAETLVNQAREAEQMPGGLAPASFYAFGAQLLKPGGGAHAALHDNLLRHREFRQVGLPECTQQQLVGPAMQGCIAGFDRIKVAAVGAGIPDKADWEMRLPAGERMLDIALDGNAVVSMDSGSMLRVHRRGRGAGAPFRALLPANIGLFQLQPTLMSARLLGGNDFVLVLFGAAGKVADVRLYRSANGAEVALSPPAQARSAASGRWGFPGLEGLKVARASGRPVFVLAAPGGAFVFDAAGAERAALEPSHLPLEAGSAVHAVAVSEDAATLAVVRSTIEGWSLREWGRVPMKSPRAVYVPGRQVFSQALSGSIAAAIAAPGVVVTASRNEVQVWSVMEGEPVARIPGVEGVRDIQCEAREPLRCVVSHARGAGVFDVLAESPLVSFEPLANAGAGPAEVGDPERGSVAVSADRRFEAWTSGTAVEVRDRRGDVRHRHEVGDAQALAVSNDGRVAVILRPRGAAPSVPAEVRVLRAADGRILFRRELADASLLAFSRSGQRLLVGGAGVLGVADLESFKTTEIPLGRLLVFGASTDEADRFAVVSGRPLGPRVGLAAELRVVDLARGEELARARFPLTDASQVALGDGGAVVTLPVNWPGGGFRLARWRWGGEALLAEACRKLASRFTEAGLRTAMGGAGDVRVPCGPKFFASPIAQY